MYIFKITILKKNNKGIEKKIDIQRFEKREDAEIFIKEWKAEIKPYKVKKDKIYYTMEGL